MMRSTLFLAALLAGAGGSAAAAAEVARIARSPGALIEQANRAAIAEPASDGFVNAVQVYSWAEGATYRLYAAPERVSDIALQAGETLIAVAAGDTVRWIVGNTTSGAGDGRRTHVLVKPVAAGLRTNLVITTDRRVYHVELESTPRLAMTGMAWRYPHDEMLELKAAAAAAEATSPVASGVAIEALNFNYAISGDRPPWRPVRVFDDGRQTFIEFAAGFGEVEAPPLFETGADGKAELVNYRVRGRYYVVDQLLAAAELRLGSGKQQIVRIARSVLNAKRHGRRS